MIQKFPALTAPNGIQKQEVFHVTLTNAKSYLNGFLSMHT
jgi:hypothetical protein